MSLNRRASMAGLAAALAAPGLAAARTAGRWAPVETVARKMVAERLVPGLQICVRQRGATVFSRGFGKADLEAATRPGRRLGA